MFKKIVILALFVPALSTASDKKYTIWSYLNPMNYSFRGSVTKVASTNPGDYVGGFTAAKVADTAKDFKEVVEVVLKDPEKAGKAGYALTEGLVRGACEAPFNAAANGARYVHDSATAHPYVTAGVVGTGVAAAAYYKFRPLTEQEKQEQELAKSKRLADLRAARDVASADDTATEFRTCLNRHAYDNGSCEDKLKRCHSPARRLSMLNRKRAEEIASAFKEYA